MIKGNYNVAISVVMPAYNSEKYIKDSILSVLKQRYSNFELLVIDDGSTDRTENIVTQIMQEDARVILHKLPCNQGVSVARNYGVSMANGEWIAFLDSDDCWAPQKLEKQLELAKLCQSEFLFTGSAFMDENGKLVRYMLSVPEKIRYCDLLKQNLISCSSVLIKKNLIQQYPMQSLNIHEDYVTWLQILRDGTIAHGVNLPLLIYRIHSLSKSGNKLKAARMNYNSYRYVGLNLRESVYYMLQYMVRSLIKYGKIERNR